jgi:hypothetical protein
MSGTAPYSTQAFPPLPGPLPGAARLAGPPSVL